MTIMSIKMIDWIMLGKTITRYFACSALMFVIVYFISLIPMSEFASLIAQIACGAVSYFMILLVLKDNMLMYYLKLLKTKVKK